MRLMNASCDETTHLPSGYTYLKTGQIILNPQHPPLIKQMCALPLLFLKPKLHLSDDWLEKPPDEWRFGYYFLYSNDADRLFFWGRLPIVLLSLLLGFFVYKWASELYGVSAGIAALFLYVFSPGIIAHSRFVTMDIGLSCFTFISLYYLWRHVRCGKPGCRMLTGLYLGLALGTKYSAVILLPVFLVLLACRDTGKGNRYPDIIRSLSDYVIIIAVASLVVYVIYMFPRDLLFYWKYLRTVYQDHKPDYMFYLLGEFKQGGWWYYFITAFLLKTTLPVLAIFILSLSLFICNRKDRVIDGAFLLLPVLSFFVVVSTLASNIGIRYLLPVYPLIFVFASRVFILFADNRIMKSFLILLCLWHMASTVRVYPDYLAYFHELAGGPKQGYQYLDESNLDWGQDLKRLKVYLDEHSIDRVKLYYFGTASPDYYGIQWEKVTPQDWFDEPSSGYYAISIHVLIRGMEKAKSCKVNTDWLSRYEPVGRVGYSFYIYRFD